MAYQTALTIAEVINDIHRKKYLLPAIQREFVWGTDQIERLFDSLMRDYPISSFLFWSVEKEKVKDYEFYEFLRQYHERKQIHNPEANISGEEGITAVLDGQQRLTSLYIALKGTYAFKLPRKRWDNPDAYPERKLHLNILASSKEEGREYDFRFLTTDEAKIKNDTTFWFPIPAILDLKELENISQFLIDNGIFSDYTKEVASFANKALTKLYKVIHIEASISYFLEKSQELDKVLNIFIRINSGGTILSYSDLLLSIATAQWEEKNAREEITKFVDEINNVKNGFNFNKDFVLKSSLILSDFTDIAFKVDNFNKQNMLIIESNWETICKAIHQAVELVGSFGYSRETLMSNNAIIPIAYYLFKKQVKDSFISADSAKEERKNIKKWLVLSLTKRAFSGQPDNVLRPIRRIINENIDNGFPTEEIIEHFKGTNKTLVFTEEDLDNLLSYQYGQSYTFSILSLLYPSLDFRNIFHIDHIYPKSLFTNSKLRKLGVPEEVLGEFKERVNRIANLQLLEAIPNIEKSDRPFDEWLEETFTGSQEKESYLTKHHIPLNCSVDFLNFIEFFNAREDNIKTSLQKILMVNASINV
ncbi:DUF262 domain-containing protein [uncultured Lutibacter sp.]|uniref:DUF262 domain-containing protein n=1 Tax=uncultured Lutibacter sp. TaxID=437739 RepID=UPI00263291A0|nr:DUF262 domain-containing protein [uncultured Lutibacter sp.]